MVGLSQASQKNPTSQPEQRHLGELGRVLCAFWELHLHMQCRGGGLQIYLNTTLMLVWSIPPDYLLSPSYVPHAGATKMNVTFPALQ